MQDGQTIPGIINTDPSGADCVLIAANNDISSSGRKGANFAPLAIFRALMSQVEFREPISGLQTTESRVGWLSLGEMNVSRLFPANLAMGVNAVEKACLNVLSRGAFPFVVGGDHSNSIGALRALAQSVRNRREVSVVVIDAHHDLRPDDSDFNKRPFGKLAHCSAMREAVEEGFHVVQVGVRDFCEQEAEFAATHGVRVFRWLPDTLDEFIRYGFVAPPIADVLHAVHNTKVYLSIDADGFDPSVMPATGTPVAGGLTWEYGLRLIAALCSHRMLLGADICEVTVSSDERLPRLSPAEYLTVVNAARIIANIVTWSPCRRESRTV